MTNPTARQEPIRQFTQALTKLMDDFKATLKELAPILAGLSVPLFLMAAVYGSVAWVSATQEAAAFNRVTTGPKVTTWDAVWLDLRVEAQQ